MSKRGHDYKKATIRSWMLSYLMIFIVPLVFFIAFLAVFTSLLSGEVGQNNRMTIEFVRHEMDQIFREFNSASQELYVNSDIQELRAYGRLDEINSYDLYTMITTISRALGTRSSLSGLILYAPSLDLYVSDQRYGRISSMALLDEYNFPFSQDEIDAIFATERSSLAIFDASYSNVGGSRVARMLIVRPLSFVRQGTVIYIAAVADVPVSVMSNDFFRNILIYSSFGERRLLYDFSGENGTETLDDLNGHSLFGSIYSQSPSAETNLTYVLAFDGFKYYKPIVAAALFSSLYFLMSIAIGLLLTMRIVKRNWKELESAGRESGLDLEGEGGGLYSPFVSSITKLEDEKQSLTDAVEAQTRSLKSSMLEKLLLSQDESEVISPAALKQCGIDFLSENFIVVVTTSRSADAEELLRKSFDSSQVGINSFSSPFGASFILSLSATWCEDESAVYKTVADVFRLLLLDERNLIPDAAASNITEGIRNLGDAYLEAINTMEYKKTNQMDEFVFYRDIIAISGHVKFDYPAEVSYAISDAVAQSDADTAISLMRQVVASNRERGVSPRHIRYLVFSVAGTILNTYSRLEKRYGAVIKPVVIPQILQSRNIDAAMDRLEECIRELCQSVGEAMESQLEEGQGEAHALYLKAVSLVEENYSDVLLNVSAIAGQCGVSIAYLSRIFKKYHQMNLSDYIASYRMERARELLIKEDLPLGEIAVNCGFGSLRTFMRIFRKYEGVSPGHYRQVKREEMDGKA